jgi:hypothetical protein
MVCDFESSGRPSSSVTDINVDKPREVIHDDRLGTVHDFQNTKGLSHAACRRIVIGD